MFKRLGVFLRLSGTILPKGYEGEEPNLELGVRESTWPPQARIQEDVFILVSCQFTERSAALLEQCKIIITCKAPYRCNWCPPPFVFGGFFFGNDSDASNFDNVILFDRLVVPWEFHYSCTVIIDINIVGARRNLNMVVIIYQYLNNEIC